VYQPLEWLITLTNQTSKSCKPLCIHLTPPFSLLACSHGLLISSPQPATILNNGTLAGPSRPIACSNATRYCVLGGGLPHPRTGSLKNEQGWWLTDKQGPMRQVFKSALMLHLETESDVRTLQSSSCLHRWLRNEFRY